MDDRIHVLDIKKNEVQILKDRLEHLVRDMTAGLDCRVNEQLDFSRQSSDETRLRQRLSARQRYPAVIHRENLGVPEHDIGQLTHCHDLAAHFLPTFLVQDLRLRGNPLGIVAPLTAQRATFEKNCRTYARAVVDGEFLNAENYALYQVRGLHDENGVTNYGGS